MQLVTLGSMLLDVQRRANLEGLVAASNTVITLPEIRSYINEAIQELYDLLVSARSQEWYRKSYEFGTVGNQPAYPLPPDLYQLLSVDIVLAPNMVLTAHPYMESERNRFRWYPGWFYNMPVYFRLLGQTQTSGATMQPAMINFIPAPTSVNTVVLNYYPAFRKFATDGSEDNYSFDGINGWENYAIWRAAAVCLEKLEMNSDFCQSQAARYEMRINALAADKHAGDAERVHDVAADWDPWSNI